MWKKAPKLTLAALLTMTCAGCVTSQGERSIGIPTARQIPRDCENLARRVAYPAFGKGEDIRLIAAKHAVGMRRANDRLDATRECQAKQRESFARGK